MWDLTALRPWEYWDTDAEEWMEAVTIRNAYQAGIDDARAESKPASKPTR